MNRSFKTAMLAVAISLMAGCAKDDVSVPRSVSRTVSQDAVIPELSTCKIRRIYQDYGFGMTVNALFSYNSAGNPFSVRYSNEGTGTYNHYFFYDAQKRLIRYEQSYVTFPIVLHYYKYNAFNQIATDSTVNINAGNGELTSVYVSTLEYDPSGRVIKETIVNKYKALDPLDPTRRPTYTYDNRGNLAVAGWKSSGYDNKINPLRQNWVFQFIHRNYSMNNAAVQPKYNSRGEPLSLKPNNDYFFNEKEVSKIIYDCQ